ncbi:MAG: hypothetical protein HY652_07035 [Acidobacteria bacterium]|nr:hypothetical protein [Acidobacteriota bacterium]
MGIAKPTIFIVGEEWKPRTLIRAQLREEGFEVTGLETLEEAEQLVRRGIAFPDLLIYDTPAQTLDLNTLQRLKAWAARSSVLVSTSASALAGMDLEREGLHHVLVRPFLIEDVVRKVRLMLRTVLSGEDESPAAGTEKGKRKA